MRRSNAITDEFIDRVSRLNRLEGVVGLKFGLDLCLVEAIRVVASSRKTRLCSDDLRVFISNVVLDLCESLYRTGRMSYSDAGDLFSKVRMEVLNRIGTRVLVEQARLR